MHCSPVFPHPYISPEISVQIKKFLPKNPWIRGLITVSVQHRQRYLVPLGWFLLYFYAWDLIDALAWHAIHGFAKKEVIPAQGFHMQKNNARGRRRRKRLQHDKIVFSCTDLLLLLNSCLLDLERKKRRRGSLHVLLGLHSATLAQLQCIIITAELAMKKKNLDLVYVWKSSFFHSMKSFFPLFIPVS